MKRLCGMHVVRSRLHGSLELPKRIPPAPLLEAAPKTQSHDRASLAPRRWMRRLRQAAGQADEAIAARVEAILPGTPPGELRVPGGPSGMAQAA